MTRYPKRKSKFRSNQFGCHVATNNFAEFPAAPAKKSRCSRGAKVRYYNLRPAEEYARFRLCRKFNNIAGGRWRNFDFVQALWIPLDLRMCEFTRPHSLQPGVSRIGIIFLSGNGVPNPDARDGRIPDSEIYRKASGLYKYFKVTKVLQNFPKFAKIYQISGKP